jgi:hypothetical protein
MKTTAARLPRLSATQRRALDAVLTSGRGAFESSSGWDRGVYSKGPAMFFTGGFGKFRWATGEALVDAGLLEPQHYGPNTIFVPTIVAHTVVALLKDA